jgi:DNA helicase-2/ATP-dependent DNA helicase PcrA
MPFYADLHIHSRFSRATSKGLDLSELAYWARRKGVTVVGTGDFTHPVWLAELKDQLVPAETGLYRLRDDLAAAVNARVEPRCEGDTRFMLQAEISTIYKKADKTRKVHHLLFAPDLDTAQRISDTLGTVGNITSDGRPILGLDSRDLLEITLEAGENTFLVPAHIWTPWFSAMGSKSGFDSIAECYGDLADHIFAVETGLSSDPPMNWRLSSLDRYRLVSNSDAHSAAKLARECNVFDTEVDYLSLRRALETGEGYGGTIEFFPDEGKYHLDGHRKCRSRLSPQETKARQGLCPVCGKQVTVGVEHRVDDLADRPEGFRPDTAAAFRSFVPLPEVLSEILGVGPATKKVQKAYDQLMASQGPELQILEHAPLSDLEPSCSPVFAEAIRRMRAGQVVRDPGYDGEYGRIRLFKDNELSREAARGARFNPPPAPAVPATSTRPPEPSPAEPARTSAGMLEGLDPDQRTAAQMMTGPLLIVAGPGTGKTRTLTHRIAHLVQDQGVPPDRCLAITFTRRAAEELRERLERLIPEQAAQVAAMTFHALGYDLVREHAERLRLNREFRVAGTAEQLGVMMEAVSETQHNARRLLDGVSAMKRSRRTTVSAATEAAFDAYQQEMRVRSLIDFDDLIRLPVLLFEQHPALAERLRTRYTNISIDEYQDIDELQYRLVQLLAGSADSICAIGDPDQAIYGFRGSDVRFFQRFAQDFAGTRTVSLTRNYRSGGRIVEASLQAIAPGSLVDDRKLEPALPDPAHIEIHTSASDRAEAEFVVHRIEQLIGGSGCFSLDSDFVDATAEDAYSFSDVAVLYRTEAQAAVLANAFERSGMPFFMRSHACLVDAPLAERVLEGMASLVDAPEDLSECFERTVASLDASPADIAPMIAALRRQVVRSHDLARFRSELALGVDVDAWDPRADRVSLLTLHAAKGLEFRVVFIVGCDDGILPLRRGSGDACDIDEERRLLFVGMTRARDGLFLSHAVQRLWQGRKRDLEPSPFLTATEETLLDRSRTRKPTPPRRVNDEQLDLF